MERISRRVIFMQKAFSNWARSEIYKAIRESPSTPPSIVVENFMYKMDKFACYGGDGSFMFSVAKDTAEYFLDQLLAGKIKL